MKMRHIASLVIGLALILISQAAAAGNVEDDYLKAKSCYGELKILPAKSTTHAAWDRCINLFEGVEKKYPKSERAPQALYSAGKLQIELYDRLKKVADAEAAIKTLNQLVREYPQNSLADDALLMIGKLRHDPLKQDDKAKSAFNYIIEHYPKGDMAPKAEQELAALESGGAEKAPKAQGEVKEVEETAGTGVFDENVAGARNPATLSSIEIEDKKGETFVSLKLTGRVTYSLDFTELGPRTKAPPKLELLLSYTKPSPAIAKKFSVSSQNLSKIGVKKSLLGSGTRLEFEMTPGSAYDISNKGEKIIIRFKRAGDKPSVPPPTSSSSKKAKAADGAKPFVFVIDPGHGGQDEGAVGPGGAKEKDVTLAISKTLAAKLKKLPDTKVYLTRDSDTALTLEDRNAVAVSKKADLFISIHANAAEDHRMSGIETYYLNNATDRAAAKLASRENKASKNKLSAVEHILSTMLQNNDAAESELLARDVQSSLVDRIGKKYKVHNRNVRSALFYVLVGAKCPAILVETSFISNPREEKRLVERSYQSDLATSVADGVLKFIKTSDKRMVSL